VCFGDPAGTRAFTVAGGIPATAVPLLRLQDEERAVLAADALPGYRRIALAYATGGADWEYTWQPGDGPRRHARRVLPAAGDDEAFVLQWTTREQDWPADVSLQQLVVAAFAVHP
jgi:hypothetical protein